MNLRCLGKKYLLDFWIELNFWLLYETFSEILEQYGSGRREGKTFPPSIRLFGVVVGLKGHYYVLPTTGQLELKLMSNFSQETGLVMVWWSRAWQNKIVEESWTKKFPFFRVQKEKKGGSITTSPRRKSSWRAGCQSISREDREEAACWKRRRRIRVREWNLKWSDCML